MSRRASLRAFASASRAGRSAHTPTVSARFVAVLVLLFVTPRPAAAAPVELVGALPVTIPPATKVADVWGWVHPTTGREYAIVGINPFGINIIDVTVPSVPVLVKNLSNVPGFDTKTWGNYLYACDGNGDGNDTRVLNLLNPSNPTLYPSLLPSAHNITISDAGMLYLSFPGIRALDLALDPVNPFVWFAGDAAGHDATCRGNLVYDFTGLNGARIMRYSTPNNLTILGTCFDPGIAYYHSGDHSADGKHLFVTDELAVHPAADVTIFDIDPPATPVKVGTISDHTANIHNLYVVGDVLYASYYTAGFKAFNIANPASPSLIGAYDTNPQTGESYTLGGAFGVYPFLPSGNILVSDTDFGLYVFRLTTTVAVRFSDVAARVRDGRVVVSWKLHADERIDGFHVYRSASAGERRLTQTPLAAGAREFVDDSVTPGAGYGYVIAAVRPDGSEERSVRVTAAVPEIDARLVSVHPNPFRPATTISFETATAAPVRVEVYDARGARVRTLLDAHRGAGAHEVAWDGRDDAGGAVAAGVYFARLQAGKQAFSRRMVLLR